MSKAIDVMPGDTWTGNVYLCQHRNGQMRPILWGFADTWRLEQPHTTIPEDRAFAALRAMGYTINHAQPEAKPVRVTHGVVDTDFGLVAYLGSEADCLKFSHGRPGTLVVPLAFGPETP